MASAAPCLPRAVFGVPVHDVANDDDVAELATLRATVPHLWRCVLALPARERQVTVHRFGLFGVRPKTLREVAGELGVSVGTVHSSERRALELLRDSF